MPGPKDLSLTPALHLGDAPWVHDDRITRVLSALQDQTVTTPQVLLVGGAVRNAVMGRPISDIDLATTHTPDVTMARATMAGLRAIPTGIDHGTVTLVVDGVGFEVTTLRVDTATDGRHAVVQFGTDWAIDAARRDFTMNALYADGTGTIYDPLGRGLDDARAGRVRFVGDPAARIAEDYLRLLRFFRFHAQYGIGAPDRDALAACAAAADKLVTLSRERITTELMRWLAAPDPLPTLRAAYSRGVMRYIIPAACDLDILERVVAMQVSLLPVLGPDPRTHGSLGQAQGPSTLLRLLIILNGADPQPILRLSTKDARFIQTVETVVLEPVHNVPAAKRDMYRHGADVFWARLIVDIAEAGGDVIPPDILALRDWTPPKFPVTAAEIMAREGLTPGPALGERLRTLEQAWVERGFTD
jgi:poly(A) polymerase